MNKITPDKFSKLSDELLHCELDSPAILKGVVVLIFNKALEEPKYSSMYAQLCRILSERVKNFEYENPGYVRAGPHDNTFCKYLLAKCQHEFNNRLQASEAFGDGPLSEEEEERRELAKKLMLGNIKFICELGKQNLADEGILHRCIVQLCKKKNNIKHTVEDFECLCQIMKTVGKLLDTERGKSLMDQYFSRMEKYANGNELPLRIKFKIQDVLDLRRNKWVPRTIQYDQNPKTLGQIREEATKDYSFLQPGGSIMGNFSANAYNNQGMPLNVRGSSSYGQPPNAGNHPPVSGQRALDDMYGANLPSFGNSSSNSNSASNSMNSSFDNSGAGNKFGDGKQSDRQQSPHAGNPGNYQQQPAPRRIIPNQPQFASKSHPNKLNDMSSSSSNSSLRDDEQMNQRNQHSYNSRNNPQQPPKDGQQPAQYRPVNSYHDSRPGNYQNRDRYNNNPNPGNYPNNNYPNRNNSGERNLNKMGNLSLRDQGPGSNRNSELPPRFQKMQQQQQGGQPSNQPYNQPHRNYGNPSDQPYNQPPPSHHNQQRPNYGGGSNYSPNNQPPYNQQAPNQYQQRPNYGNNSLNSPMGQPPAGNANPKIINPVPNFGALDSKEISLRPAKNFFSMKPPNPLGGSSSRPDAVDQPPQQQPPPGADLNRNPMKPNMPLPGGEPAGKPAAPLTVQSVQARLEQQQKDQKEEYLKQVDEALGKLIEKAVDEPETLKKIKELKTTKVSKSQLLVHVIKYSLDKSEQERELITKFFTKFKEEEFCSGEDYVAAYKQALSAMRDLEVDVPKVKSFVAVYIAHGVKEEIIDLKVAFELTVKNIYYPLFLLCLQYLGQNQDQQWLIKKFADSKLDLMLALPEIDRNKERLSEVLRDRQLGFLYPLLRIESELMKQVNSGQDISPKSLYSWIKEHVDPELQKSEGFVITLFTCIAKYVTEKTKAAVAEIEAEEASNTDKRIIELQKDVLLKYAQIFQSFLLERPNLQLALLYALQTYCHRLAFPKGMIFRWFIMLYDLEIVDSEVFLTWKEEVNDDYPDKGKALFQVNTWLNWLEKAEEDDEDEEDE